MIIIKIMITIIMLAILIIIIVKIVIVIVIIIISIVIIKIIIIKAIKIIIIVIKIAITVIMKKTIVLKLMKIVVQSHNHKTYICRNFDNAHKKFIKTSYRPTLPHQVERNKGTKNRNLQTLSSVLRPKGATVFRILLQ